MADGPTGEKTEEATPQKMQDARKKGQVGKSRDIISAFVFIATFFALVGVMDSIFAKVGAFIIECTKVAASHDPVPIIIKLLPKGLDLWIFLCIPIIGVGFIVGLISNYAQVGFLLTVEPLKPQLKKINPINGFKQLFSKKKLVEGLKSIIKFMIVFYVVYGAIKGSLHNLVLSLRVDLPVAVNIAGIILKDIATKVSIVMIIIGVADYFWQRYTFKKGLMMSKYDVKQEYKQSEGDPQLKSERKQLAQEMVMEAGEQNTAGADAVVTNPVHIAVAIKYDEKSGSAPVVLAKGLRKNAERIKEIARDSQVPIIRNVPLAQSLNKLDIDEEIPEDLYEAVAEVLNFVYELQKK